MQKQKLLRPTVSTGLRLFEMPHLRAARSGARVARGCEAAFSRAPRTNDAVEILWEDRNTYFRGRLKRRLGREGMSFYVVYDDGDVACHNLDDHVWRFADAKKGRGRKRGRGKVAVEGVVELVEGGCESTGSAVSTCGGEVRSLQAGGEEIGGRSEAEEEGGEEGCVFGEGGTECGVPPRKKLRLRVRMDEVDG